MADNIIVNGKEIATDEVSIGGRTVHVQRAKMGYGPDGTWTADVALTAPLPVDAALNTGIIQSGGTQLAPVLAYANVTADADLVSAVASKRIRVLAMSAGEEDQTADVILSLEDANGGSVVAEFAGFDIQTIQNLPFNPIGWFETTAGNALYANVTGTTPNLNINVVYVTV